MREILYRWVMAYMHALGFILYGGGGAKDGPPPPPAPEKPPAPSKAPERAPYSAANRQSALTGGPASTMLTGAGGVAPSSLSLGRSVLYDNESSKLGS